MSNPKQVFSKLFKTVIRQPKEEVLWSIYTHHHWVDQKQLSKWWPPSSMTESSPTLLHQQSAQQWAVQDCSGETTLVFKSLGFTSLDRSWNGPGPLARWASSEWSGVTLWLVQTGHVITAEQSLLQGLMPELLRRSHDIKTEVGLKYRCAISKHSP